MASQAGPSEANVPNVSEQEKTSTTENTVGATIPETATLSDTAEAPPSSTLQSGTEPPTAEATIEPAAAAADFSDHDSLYEESSDVSRYTASLLSDIKAYKFENGRRYHAYREGEYIMPNDEDEQDRQDLLHHVRNLTLDGALYLAPFAKPPQRVLDIGTGTGIWAIDFADQHPSAEVIGTDLSPIQPTWVPPNLFFQVEDAEAEWLFSRSNPFDFVHMRDLGGSISDWEKLVGQTYTNLKPGGWIELQEFEVTLKSDDDSMQYAPNLSEYITRLHEASEIFNKPMNIAEGHKQRLIDAGYQNVRDEVFKVPSSGWPKDALQKEIGRYNLCSLLLAVEAYALALFTRVLGWSYERTQVFLAGVRNDLKSKKVHSYCNLHIVYGQKPEAIESSEGS